MTNPWLERRVLNYAHQGGAREGPSSTLWAMQRALDAGAHALELDVHGTADGHVVVCHDATVDRTANGTGAIADMTLAELQALDNAWWWVPGEVADHDRPDDEYPLRGLAARDETLRIPTLQDVLDAFPDTFLNLDIKLTAPAVAPYEHKVARILESRGRTDDVIVASFLDVATDNYLALAPDAHVSFGMEGTRHFWTALRDGRPVPPSAHVALQIPPFAGDIELVTSDTVAAAHAEGVAVHVWTIDDPAEMQRLIGLGVDGVMTDTPSVLAAVLADTGSAWDRGPEAEA